MAAMYRIYEFKRFDFADLEISDAERSPKDLYQQNWTSQGSKD